MEQEKDGVCVSETNLKKSFKADRQVLMPETWDTFYVHSSCDIKTQSIPPKSKYA